MWHEVRVRTDYMNLKYHYNILILGGGGVRAFLENLVEFFDLGPKAERAMGSSHI